MREKHHPLSLLPFSSTLYIRELSLLVSIAQDTPLSQHRPKTFSPPRIAHKTFSLSPASPITLTRFSASSLTPSHCLASPTRPSLSFEHHPLLSQASQHRP
ncbi:BnaC03g75220D [Brassica napus]|uniref:(rape) hypothetical protein n=1 Tax=Brassica napus TaxID=3708 RepID=A0A078IVF5_BRANA|nr:unnamed protein product [Brassica napus]CDY53951.1 BnaC03g75220D [Brassica napus]